MNWLFVGYLVGFLSAFGDKEKFGVEADFDRVRKFHRMRHNIQDTRGYERENFAVKAEVDGTKKNYHKEKYMWQNVQDTESFTSTAAPEPDFKEEIHSIKVVAGKDAVLRCVVQNLGKYQISWTLVEKKQLISMGTTVYYTSDRISVTTVNSTSWFLHIKNVTKDDIGYYTCQINTKIMKTMAGYLHVVEPPEFVTNMTHGNVTVMENSNVTLSCKATGNPAPVIKWRREDGQPFTVGSMKTREYESEELIFSGVSREQMAAYLCVASNEVPPPISRRIYLDVKFPPLIWIQNNLVGARENIDISLECQTEGHPLTDNFWLRDDAPVVSKSSRYQSHLARNFYRSYMRLTIRNLQPEDYGTYQCVAKNAIGETYGTIKLFKQHLPPPPSPKPEVKTALPTRKVILVSSTTDWKYLVPEIASIENIHSPGNQQKYGDGRVDPDVENAAMKTLSAEARILFLCSIYTIWTNMLKMR